MQIGIVGLPHSGKSTLFDALLANRVNSAEYKPKHASERGIINVSDERLDILTEMYRPKRKVPAMVEYVKVPGLDPQNENGRPSDFFAQLKSVDEILLVVRRFEDELYPHPFGKIDPHRDIRFATSEFILSDMVIVERRIERLEKQLRKVRNDNDEKELQLLKTCHSTLEEELPLRQLQLNDDDRKRLRGYQFLTMKPILIVLNIAEEHLSEADEILIDYQQYTEKMVTVMTLSLKAEAEIAELNEHDREIFLKELGINKPAMHRLVGQSYKLLGLISFFTVGEDECRAWTIQKGTRAQKAAGVIHSDLDRGFIRADVVSWQDLVQLGDLSACRGKGVLRLEGKDYPVRDGDVMEIRFNV